MQLPLTEAQQPLTVPPLTQRRPPLSPAASIPTLAATAVEGPPADLLPTAAAQTTSQQLLPSLASMMQVMMQPLVRCLQELTTSQMSMQASLQHLQLQPPQQAPAGPAAGAPLTSTQQQRGEHNARQDLDGELKSTSHALKANAHISGLTSICQDFCRQWALSAYSISTRMCVFKHYENPIGEVSSSDRWSLCCRATSSGPAS